MVTVPMVRRAYAGMCTAWIRSDGKSAPGYGTPFAKFSMCLHILRSWSGLGRGPANPNFVLPAVRGFLRRRRPRRMEVGLAGTLAKEDIGFTHWLFGISSGPPSPFADFRLQALGSCTSLTFVASTREGCAYAQPTCHAALTYT